MYSLYDNLLIIYDKNIKCAKYTNSEYGTRQRI